MSFPGCHSLDVPGKGSPHQKPSPDPAPPKSCEDSSNRVPNKRFEIKDIQLPSPPAVAIRILEAVKNDSVPTQELVRIISSDPALALKVLRAANSPVYTRSTKVATVKNAITILGVNVLKNLALSFVIIDTMAAEAKMPFEFDSFWRRSITSAVSTEIILQHMGMSHDDLFISALLQDIGTVILSLYLAGRGTAPSLTECRHLGSPEDEQGLYGFDHQEVGCVVLKEWGLPDSICSLVGNHHKGEDAPRDLLPRLRILTAANKLASLFHGTGSPEVIEGFFQNMQSLCNATKAEVERLIGSAHERTREVLSFFEIDPGNMKTCSQILQEANEELGRLNLTYEQMVMELRQAKESAEELAQELTEANSMLRDLAFKDPLTGLYNHGHFQELLDHEIERAFRYGHPLSLVLFDLDHFKLVNDQYGHLTGDGVLKRISELARKNVRACDYVARYGGEEFGVILPETDATGSLVLAERIRKSIEKTEIFFNDVRIVTTVSMGVATWYPAKGGKSKSQIVAAADRALYESKRQGRNRTTLVQF